MKIAFITDSRIVHAQRWAISLQKHVDEFFVISAANVDIEGCNVYKFNIFTDGKCRLKTLIKKYIYIIKSIFLIMIKRPDIIHVHFLRPDITAFAYLFFKKNIISVWGTDVSHIGKQGTFNNWIRKKTLSKAKAVTATTKHLLDVTSNYCEKEKIQVIPFGVDLKLFKPPVKKKINKIPHIAFVKHLRKIYAPDVLIEALRFIKTDIFVSIVGNGDMYDELKEKIKKYNLINVRFLGFIPNNKLPAFYSTVDIYVMPSRYETFGVSAIEAEAMEIPVIATNVGGVPEAIQDGKTGLLVKADDPKELAKAIEKLIENKELYLHLKLNCRSFVVENFDWDKNVNSVISLYNQIVK